MSEKLSLLLGRSQSQHAMKLTEYSPLEFILLSLMILKQYKISPEFAGTKNSTIFYIKYHF